MCELPNIDSSRTSLHFGQANLNVLIYVFSRQLKLKVYAICSVMFLKLFTTMLTMHVIPRHNKFTTL